MLQNKRLYMDEKSKALFEDKWFSDYERKEILETKIVENGIILPIIDAHNSFNLPDAETGVLNSNKEYIVGSGMREFSFDNLIIPKKIEYDNREVMWGGMLIFHYGHFILQCTTRLYYYIQNRDKIKHVIFVSKSNVLPSYINDFFSLINLPPEKIILIDEFRQFKKIICPPISSEYYGDYTNDFLMPFRECSKKIEPARYEKVYLTRKHWHGVNKCFGEENIEKLFNRNGFKSVSLEKLSLREQISIFKGAKIMAGINGTSFHNTLFSASGQKLIMLNRNEEYDSQYIINQATKANWYVIKVHLNPLPVTHPNGPFIVGVTEYMKQFLKDHGMKDFGIKFNPNKYLNSFLNKYCENYSNPSYYNELVARNKDKINCDDLIGIYLTLKYSKIILLKNYLLSKITIGKGRIYFKKLYKFTKSCKNNKIKNFY